MRSTRPIDPPHEPHEPRPVGTREEPGTLTQGDNSRVTGARPNHQPIGEAIMAIPYTGLFIDASCTSLEVDLLYVCDSKATLNKVSRWIGSGPRTTLAGDANADIMTSIIECVRERVLRGARTFLVKVKAHRREPLNERADTQAENARHLLSECRQWTTRPENDVRVERQRWSKACDSMSVHLCLLLQDLAHHALVNAGEREIVTLVVCVFITVCVCVCVYYCRT
jgi:ribonuclease HI